MSRVTISVMTKAADKINAANNKSVEGLCVALVALGKKLVARDTGELQNTVMAKGYGFSIGFNTSKGKKAPEDQKLDFAVKLGRARFGTASDHWYPEFGTRFQKAQPAIRPAGELVVQNGDAARIVAKYNKAEMERQFKAGIRQFKTYKDGTPVPANLQALQ